MHHFDEFNTAARAIAAIGDIDMSEFTDADTEALLQGLARLGSVLGGTVTDIAERYMEEWNADPRFTVAVAESGSGYVAASDEVLGAAKLYDQLYEPYRTAGDSGVRAMYRKDDPASAAKYIGAAV